MFKEILACCLSGYLLKPHARKFHLDQYGSFVLAGFSCHLQVYLILLRLPVLLLFADTALFYKTEGLNNLVSSKFIYNNSICSLHVSLLHFGNSHQYFIPFRYWFVILICDQ